jgi:hypothetical protein
MGMSLLRCPICDLPLQSDDVNVGTNVAFCRHCGTVDELSRLAGVSRVPDIPVTSAYSEQNRLARFGGESDLDTPPAGTWFRDDGDEVVIGATSRSLADAIGLLFLNMFLNGMLCIVLGVAIAGMLVALNVPIPAWAPLPNPHNSTPPVNTIGFATFLLIVLTPFVAVGIILLGRLLMAIAGQEVVRVRGSIVTVFVGVGPLGWRRGVKASRILRVQVVYPSNHREYGDDSLIKSKPAILIDADRTIKFGQTLSEDRRAYVVAALRAVLMN